MPKQKIIYICANCGYESPRWLGKCPTCDEWNTFTEEIKEKRSLTVKRKSGDLGIVTLSGEIDNIEERYKSNIVEFDRVLGGGLIPGSVVLIGGDPGIGKSTLVLQAAAQLKNQVLYVTGEESLNQIKLRANRLKIKSGNVLLLAETDLDTIAEAIEKTSPEVVIIDSIQTVYKSSLDNAPGTITQIRECTAAIMEKAKRKNFTAVLIGHVTKEGYIAGPKVLEHIVDTVLQFEGERNHTYRILRAAKNRFGSTNEIGIFEMHDNGLTEVKNPSEIFLSERDSYSTGSIVTSSMEGSRPVLLEVQALVTPSNYGNPQRVTTGFDYRRMSILLAVLEKRANLRLSATNVFLNMAGGIKIDEPAVDLAVCSAIASSLLEKPGKQKIVVIGEVGLGGEIRSVGHVEKRIKEAEKLGFSTVVIPKNNLKSITAKNDLNIIPVDNIYNAIEEILIQE
ncbi:MAG: DNA repair protein RadA [Melioribacteraceae bacterium]|nr:DNA repair protein RadA [Melioribacteraceae bacterium]MCF8353629.1 DNA repair protein RadA [Melioribacteraceae bacterium]MCF8393399.1 DNA repair protein RadA [Melioribacteraceae bacterium]MCF8419256.1 DNA repair protein RadA [Melioribacteraceae bacterium]